jgi:hypothetical protein
LFYAILVRGLDRDFSVVEFCHDFCAVFSL